MQNFKGQLKECMSLKYFSLTLCIHPIQIRLETTPPASHLFCFKQTFIFKQLPVLAAKDRKMKASF